MAATARILPTGYDVFHDSYLDTFGVPMSRVERRSADPALTTSGVGSLYHSKGRPQDTDWGQRRDGMFKEASKDAIPILSKDTAPKNAATEDWNVPPLRSAPSTLSQSGISASSPAVLPARNGPQILELNSRTASADANAADADLITGSNSPASKSAQNALAASKTAQNLPSASPVLAAKHHPSPSPAPPQKMWYK